MKKNYKVKDTKAHTFPYANGKGEIVPESRENIPFFITKSNPTCYANVILPDGTLIQIPYPC